MSESEPVVAIWRDEWLPPSETFIRNQLMSLRHWRALAVTRRHVSSDLGMMPDYVLNVNNHIRGPIAKVWGDITHGRSLKFFLRSRNVRLLHAHFGTGGVSALWHARRTRIPLVCTFHGFDVTRLAHSKSIRNRIYRQQLKQLFGYSSALIAVSDFIGQQLVSLGAPREKITVLPIGIPIESDVRSSSETGSGIVFVGRLVEKKGVADLFDAVNLLSEPLRRTPITIVGYGPMQKKLQAHAQLLGLDCRFTGKLSSDEIAEVLSSAAIFCGPSKTADDGDAEGFGMVFLEAALQGLPVVAYRHGGVSEAVCHGVTGLLAEEGDVEELSSCIANLLENPQLAKQMGSAGRSRTQERFNVENRTMDLEMLYDHVSGLTRE